MRFYFFCREGTCEVGSVIGVFRFVYIFVRGVLLIGLFLG